MAFQGTSLEEASDEALTGALLIASMIDDTRTTRDLFQRVVKAMSKKK